MPVLPLSNLSIIADSYTLSSKKGDDAESTCNLKVSSTSEATDSGLLFQAQSDDPSRWLRKQSKLAFVYSVRADMKNEKRSSTFTLGVVAVDWLPKKMELPKEVTQQIGEEDKAHGPLALQSPATVKFLGPMCYIEKAPFKSSFKCSPSVPQVSIPFEVTYTITNVTNTHQQLAVVLDGIQKEHKEDVLVCGLVNGALRLAPFETQMLSYIALGTRPGMATLPNVCVSSSRYNSWVVNEREGNSQRLFINP